MYIEDLPRTMPQYGLDMSLRIELVKALDNLAMFGTTADKAQFSLAMEVAKLLANDGTMPTAVALVNVTRAIVDGTTSVDMIFPGQYFSTLRPITAAQFTVTTGVVTSVEVVAPNVLRITGTGLGAGDTIAFTADADSKDVLRYSSWVAAASNASVGTVAAATLAAMGATGVAGSATQITLSLAYPNTGRPAFGAFAVNNAGTVTAVSYPDDYTIVLTGTGYATGDIVTYTDPANATSLTADAGYRVFTLATGASAAVA